MTYWLPAWWEWMEHLQRWDRCRACLEYNHSPCVSCEIPPGLLGLAQLVGGETVAIGGNLRGNATITGARQARAASRQPGAEQVTDSLRQQNRTLNIDANTNALNRNHH